MAKPQVLQESEQVQTCTAEESLPKQQSCTQPHKSSRCRRHRWQVECDCGALRCCGLCDVSVYMRKAGGLGPGGDVEAWFSAWRRHFRSPCHVATPDCCVDSTLLRLGVTEMWLWRDAIDVQVRRLKHCVMQRLFTGNPSTLHKPQMCGAHALIPSMTMVRRHVAPQEPHTAQEREHSAPKPWPPSHVHRKANQR